VLGEVSVWVCKEKEGGRPLEVVHELLSLANRDCMTHTTKLGWEVKLSTTEAL